MVNEENLISNTLDTEDWSVFDDDEEQMMLVETSLDDWTTVDFVKVVQARKKSGNTKASFERDVKMWQGFLCQLETYSKRDYMDEINDMDLTIPQEESELSELQGIYSKLVRYRDRLTRMKYVVNSQYEIFTKAYKSLRLTAVSLFSGTAKDKEASAEYLVQPFYAGTLESKNMLDLFNDVIETIKFASDNLYRMMKEKEVKARTNYFHTSEGSMHNLEKETQLPTINAFDTSDVKTIEVRTRKKVSTNS